MKLSTFQIKNKKNKDQHLIHIMMKNILQVSDQLNGKSAKYLSSFTKLSKGFAGLQPAEGARQSIDRCLRALIKFWV